LIALGLVLGPALGLGLVSQFPAMACRNVQVHLGEPKIRLAKATQVS
jgi:hypothetical protein